MGLLHLELKVTHRFTLLNEFLSIEPELVAIEGIFNFTVLKQKSLFKDIYATIFCGIIFLDVFELGQVSFKEMGLTGQCSQWTVDLLSCHVQASFHDDIITKGWYIFLHVFVVLW